jgi:phosphonate transport system substrate-binding protein
MSLREFSRARLETMTGNLLTSRREALAAMAALAVTPAWAQQDWRKTFPELRMGVSSAENEALAMSRHEPVAKYLGATLGVPVRIYRVADYAGLVEGMRSNQIEFARFGPAVYSLGRRVMGDRLRPLLRDMDLDGSEGYYSIVIVKTDSPYRSMEDLKGKVMAFADPNSTSGYAFPRYFLKRQGFDPDTHFKTTTFSGSHENSVRAIANGQFDAAATHWTNEKSGMVQRLESRNMVPKGSTRIVWRSPLIPNSPFCVRSDLPESLIDLVVSAMLGMKEQAPDVWKNYTEGQVSRLVQAKHEDYRDVVAVIEENDRERKTRPGG